MAVTFNAKQLIPFSVFLVTYVFGIYAARCGVSDVCLGATDARELVFTVFKPLWVFSLYAMAGALFLPFVREKIFKIWIRFAIPFLALTVFLIATAPEAMNSWFYVFRYAKSDIALYMGGAFTAITLILLPIASLALYSKSKGYR